MQLYCGNSSGFRHLLAFIPLCVYAVCFTENLTGYGLLFSASISQIFFSAGSKLVTLSLFCTLLSAGMLIFSLSCRFVPKGRIIYLITALCILRLFIWMALRYEINHLLFVNTLLIILYALDLGFVSAFAFYFGLKLISKDMFARYIGISLAFAVTLTMLVGKLSIDSISSNFYLGIFCQLAIAGLFFVRTPEQPPEFTVRKTRVSSGMRRYLKNSIIMVALMSLLHGMSDGVDYFIFKNIEVDVVHEYYRLVYVISLVAASIIYDRFKYYQMLLAIIATGLLLLNFQLYQNEYYSVVHYLDSSCSGFMLVFIMNIFAEASVNTDKPWLWCNFGRIIQFSLGSLGTLITVFLLVNDFPSIALFLYLAAQSCLIFMLYHGSMNYQIEKQYRTVSLRLNNELNKNDKTLRSVAVDTRKSSLSTGSQTDSSDKGVFLQKGNAGTVSHQMETAVPAKGKSRADKRDRANVPDLNYYIAQFGLTQKEEDILKEIVQLKTIKDMSSELKINERTVKYRISRILIKTGTRNQRELLKKLNY